MGIAFIPSRKSCHDVKLNTQLHIMYRFRMSGAKLVLSPLRQSWLDRNNTTGRDSKDKSILSIKLRLFNNVHKVETYITDTVIPPYIVINTKKTPKTVCVREATGQVYKFTNYVYERRPLQPSTSERNAVWYWSFESPQLRLINIFPPTLYKHLPPLPAEGYNPDQDAHKILLLTQHRLLIG